MLIVLWRFGKKDFVKCIITELVARAEQLYGSGSGQVKLAFVLSELYKIFNLSFLRSKLSIFSVFCIVPLSIITTLSNSP